MTFKTNIGIIVLNRKDKLTAFNGRTITYDAIGNPLNDGTWTYEWQAGRRLYRMSKTGMTVQFVYDYNGLRTQKIVTENGVTTTTNYTLHGKLVTHMTCGSDSMHFYYDAQSRPAKVDFNGTVYTYIHNLQGDIVGLIHSGNTLSVEYKYDAWGRLLSTTGDLASTLGALNPFRYRGYVYDEETGLYYLRSRYYMPSIGRFANEDCIIFQRFHCSNMFCYCSNNPVMRIDNCGSMWKELASGVIGLAKAVKSAFEALPDIVENYKKSERKFAYAEETIASVFLLVCIRNSVTYNEKTELLRIPNNTNAANRFMTMASYPKSEFFFDYDWAEMMAYVAVDKYESGMGKSFHTETSKVAYEVRVHAQLYAADIFPSHTDITDVSTYEGKGCLPALHSQWWIDLFYSWGAR